MKPVQNSLLYGMLSHTAHDAARESDLNGRFSLNKRIGENNSSAIFVLDRFQQSDATISRSDLIKEFESFKQKYPLRAGDISSTLTDLKRYGLVTNPARGVWQATPKLRSLAAQLGRRLTVQDLAKLRPP